MWFTPLNIAVIPLLLSRPRSSNARVTALIWFVSLISFNQKNQTHERKQLTLALHTLAISHTLLSPTRYASRHSKIRAPLHFSLYRNRL